MAYLPASQEWWGPPFPVPSPYTRFVSPTPAGFWSSHVLNPSTGGIVLQLGTHQSTLAGQSGAIKAQFIRNFTPRVSGTHAFRLGIDGGPLSRLFQRGGVDLLGHLEVRSPRGRLADLRPFLPYAARVPYSRLDLAVDIPLECGTACQLIAGVAIVVSDVQEAYAEIIARLSSLKVYQPGGWACW
jgi:hypothetical protein